MKAYERLLTYVMVPTASDEESDRVPTTDAQFVLAEKLTEEMKSIGIKDARTDDKCYVYGTIPATPGLEDKISLGFIAHMDTVADFTQSPVNPVVHRNYDGRDLELGNSGRKLEVSKFPHLPGLKGRTLITSDGNTILGADDKAGIAEIMTLAEYLIVNRIPHGKICIGFTPDEEVGAGADHFDVAHFGADFAYTVDGGPEGEIEFENFNAAEASIKIQGFNVHPGSAKDVMINAAAVGCEFHSMLPEKETPRHTQGYEGFYHLTKMAGACDAAEFTYIIRDHDKMCYEQRIAVMHEITAKLNDKYGQDTVTLKIREQYLNMAEKIKPCFHLIEKAEQAACLAGIQPQITPIRGGTDGARLSYMGLPCPNLGTGGYAFHGPYEHITAEGMEKAVEMLIKIVEFYSK